MSGVTIRDLTVAYGDHVALAEVSLTIGSGVTVAVVGPNGSGKSTLLGTISGLIRPSSGVVELGAGSAGEEPARGRVAHVLQSTIANESVPLTVAETVKMGVYGRRGVLGRVTVEDRRAVDEAIDRMQLGELAGRALHELSGGQRQRVYVAQGLAQRAEVLLLDEPITGLDLVTQEAITRVVQEERDRGRTVIFTTHDVGTARLADTVVLIATRLVASGPSAIVLTPANLARAYGSHMHVLADGTVVLDETHHHDHRHHDPLGSG